MSVIRGKGDFNKLVPVYFLLGSPGDGPSQGHCSNGWVWGQWRTGVVPPTLPSPPLHPDILTPSPPLPTQHWQLTSSPPPLSSLTLQPSHPTPSTLFLFPPPPHSLNSHPPRGAGSSPPHPWRWHWQVTSLTPTSLSP